MLINSLRAGGAERQFAETGNYLLRKGYNIKILTMEEGLAYQVKTENINLFEKDRFINLLSKIFPVRIVNLIKTMLAPAKLTRLVGKEDTILSYLYRSNLVALKLKKDQKIHRVIIADGIAPSRQYSKIQIALLKKMVKHADAGIFNSKWIALEYEKLGMPSEKVFVIYNARDIKGVIEKSKESLDEFSELFEKNKVLLHVGRFDKQKNQVALLETMKEIEKTSPKAFEEFHLVMVGKGPLLKKIQKLIQKMGLKNKVSFLGIQKNPFKFMKRSFALLLPSLWEGLPNVVIEALAVGLPVVATDCRSGPREILAPDTDFRKQTREIEHARYGILIPVEPEKEIPRNMAKAVIDLYENPELYKKYSQAGPERARDFEMEKIGPQWEEVLNSNS